MRQLAKYSFVNAKIRAMLSSLLDESRINALLEARDPGEALDILKKTPYGPLFLDADKDISRMPGVERALICNDVGICKKIEESLPGRPEKELVGLLSQAYEI